MSASAGSSAGGCAVHLETAPPGAALDGRWPVTGYQLPPAAGEEGSAGAGSASSSVGASGYSLDALPFDNRTVRELPIDQEKTNYVRTVRNACFSLVQPTPVDNPVVVSASLPALQLLGVSRDEVAAKLQTNEFAQYFSGNKLLPGCEPAAHCYCGHQFGHFSGQLGDGATMYLGEVVNTSTPSVKSRWELQFKGAGKTPYSRTADGRKVLRSSLREFLCSELMASLQVPTTRAGTVVTSDSKVVRDVFYEGKPINERATIITRIAPTFLRFGSFEIAKPQDPVTRRTGPSVGRQDIVEELTRYTLLHFYGDLLREELAPESSGATQVGDVDKSLEDAFDALGDRNKKGSLYLKMYGEVCKGSARLVAHWQALGWCHGVMNTDNCAILPWPRPGAQGYPAGAGGAAVSSGSEGRQFVFGGSESLAGNAMLGRIDNSSIDGGSPIYATGTIDYGPFGWMERFNPEYICNASDNDGRYSYEAQPHVMRWNCLKLGEQLAFLFPKDMQQLYHQQAGAGAGAASSSPSGDEPPAGASGVPQWKRLIPQFYDRHYSSTYRALMARKLGLGWWASSSTNSAGEDEKEEEAQEAAWEGKVDSLVGELLGVMQASGADYTNTFRALMAVPLPRPSKAKAEGGSSSSSDDDDEAALRTLFAASIRPQLSTVEELCKSFEPRMPAAQLGMLLMLAERDPRFADHLEGLQEELKRHEQHKKLKGRSEASKAAEDERMWLQWLAKYRAQLQAEVDALGAAGLDHEQYRRTREAVMGRANPVFVLRNWVAQEAIQAAEAGDFSVVQEVLKRMHNPYALHDQHQQHRLTAVGASGLSETSDAVAKASEAAAAKASAAGAMDVSGQPVQPGAPFLGQLPSAATASALVSDQYACKAPSWASNLRVT